MKDIAQIRKSIDKLDSQIIQALAKRMKLMDKVADYKKKNNLPVTQPQRERELVSNCIRRFKKQGFDDEAFVRKVYKLIINKGKQIQRKRIK